MKGDHLQHIVVKLEEEMLGFMDQYNAASGYLQGLISGTIQDRYRQYAQTINIASHNDVELLLPKYNRIEQFMQKEFNINYVEDKDERQQDAS